MPDMVYAALTPFFKLPWNCRIIAPLKTDRFALAEGSVTK